MSVVIGIWPWTLCVVSPAGVTKREEGSRTRCAYWCFSLKLFWWLEAQRPKSHGLEILLAVWMVLETRSDVTLGQPIHLPKWKVQAIGDRVIARMTRLSVAVAALGTWEGTSLFFGDVGVLVWMRSGVGDCRMLAVKCDSRVEWTVHSLALSIIFFKIVIYEGSLEGTLFKKTEKGPFTLWAHVVRGVAHGRCWVLFSRCVAGSCA